MRNSLSIFLGHKSTHLTMKNKLQFQKYFTEICFKRCGRYRRMHCFRKWIGNKPFLKAMLTQNYVASYGAFSSLAICLCFFFPFGENLLSIISVPEALHDFLLDVRACRFVFGVICGCH